jgi:pimeloyl-ACP methyl ester carboxylesterase
MKRLTTTCAVAFAWMACAAFAQSASGTTPSGLFYEVSGTGEPVVFIHAFSVDRRMWQPQIAVFEKHFRVVRYDLRGHGRSASPTSSYAGYEDLREVLDALKIDRATLVGLSAGSEIALNFALAYPDRVLRLVLTSSGLGGYVSGPFPWAVPPFQAAAGGDPERAANLWADTPIMALRRNVAERDRLRTLVTDNWRLWTLRRLEQPLAPPVVKRLAEITVPTLVVTGDEDLPHIWDIAAVITRGVAGSRQVVISGAGHFVNLDDEARFNESLSTFLAK